MARRRFLATVAVLSVISMTLPPPSLSLPQPLAVPVADAAHTMDFGCIQPTSTNTFINCWLKIVRPAGDTGATVGSLGMHFPGTFPGIASVSAPGYNCTQDTINGVKRLFCTGTTPLGGHTQVDFVMHVVGTCGQVQPINATYANVYGVNSTPEWTNIVFPACPPPPPPPAPPPPPPPPAPAQLQITKTAPATVTAGQGITYTLQARNVGQGTAINARVFDYFTRNNTKVPAPFTLSSTSGVTCATDAANNQFVCNLGNMAPGAVINWTMTFATPANQFCGETVRNQVDIWDGNNNANWAAATTTVTCPPPPPPPPPANTTLTVTKALAPGQANPVPQGNNVTYRLTVTNTGGATANPAYVDDIIPANTQPVNLPAGCGLATASGNRPAVRCSFANLAPGQSRTVDLTFDTAAAIPCGGSNAVVNVAEAHAANATLVSSGNVSTPVSCPAPTRTTLTIAKTTTATSVLPGGTISYVVRVTNTGTIPATGVTVTDTVHNNMTATSIPAGCVNNGATVTCSNLTVNANASIDLPFTFTVAQAQACGNGNVARNSASVTAANADAASTQLVTTPVNCPAASSASSAGAPQVSITKTAPATAVAGQTVTYQFRARNLGTGVAHNVRTFDFFIDAANARVNPQPFTYVSSNGAQCFWDAANGQVQCNLGDLASGAIVDYTLTFNVPATGLACSSVVRNQVDIWTGNQESTDWTRAQTVYTCVTGSSASSVQASSVTSVVTASSVVANSSNVSSAGIPQCRDNIDNDGDGATDLLDFSCSGPDDNDETNPRSQCQDGVDNDGDGLIDFGNDPGCQSRQDDSEFTPASSAASSFAFSFGFSSVAQNPAFTVTKTDSRTTANVGETLSYSITVTNVSNATATNVSVQDVLPAALAFVSASDNAAINGQTVTWNIATLPGGQSRTLTLSAQIRSGTAGGTVIRNVATANGSSTGEDTTTVSGGGNQRVSISIDDSPDPVDAGDELDYEIEICNEDDEDIENLTVLQILPDDVEVIDEDGGDEDDGTITWEDIDIDEDDCVTFNVTVEIDEDLEEGDELETVVLADGESDEETTDVGEDEGQEDGDLTIDKSASTSEVFPGGIVEYTLTIDNDTGEDLEDLVVEDRISGNGFTIVDDGDADERSGATLRWEIDSLDDGETQVIRYRISVDQSAYAGSIIRNDVTVEADDFDDTDSATVTVINNLPQTGFFGGTNGRNAHLRPYAGKGSDTPWAAVLSVIIAGLGTASGVGMGRRFFL